MSIDPGLSKTVTLSPISRKPETLEEKLDRHDLICGQQRRFTLECELEKILFGDDSRKRKELIGPIGSNPKAFYRDALTLKVLMWSAEWPLDDERKLAATQILCQIVNRMLLDCDFHARLLPIIVALCTRDAREMLGEEYARKPNGQPVPFSHRLDALDSLHLWFVRNFGFDTLGLSGVGIRIFDAEMRKRGFLNTEILAKGNPRLLLRYLDRRLETLAKSLNGEDRPNTEPSERTQPLTSGKSESKTGKSGGGPHDENKPQRQE